MPTVGTTMPWAGRSEPTTLISLAAIWEVHCAQQGVFLFRLRRPAEHHSEHGFTGHTSCADRCTGTVCAAFSSAILCLLCQQPEQRRLFGQSRLEPHG